MRSMRKGASVHGTWRDSEFRDEVREAFDANKVVVVCPGCFDVLHAGHVELFERVRRTQDLHNKSGLFLIVAVNTDDSVRALKGPSRPVVSSSRRLYSISRLRDVDCVVLFGEPTPYDLIESVQPHLLVKGDEPATRAGVVGSGHAGRVLLLPRTPGLSTTEMLESRNYF